eukprot:Ihof_evm1s124 gene=Ihof_evmTU1s124
MQPTSKGTTEFTQAFINNVFVPAIDENVFSKVNPATGEFMCDVTACGPTDINTAVSAAKTCFEGPLWGKATTGKQRAVALFKMADLLCADKESFAHLETMDMGKPIRDSYGDVDWAVDIFRYYANLAIDLDRKQGTSIKIPDKEFYTMLYRDPVGVVACVTPWNYALVMAAQKIAPALAAGCTVVLKPSELAPLTSIRLAEIARKSGLPPGAFNVVPGLGLAAGQSLVEHSQIDKISFTGSVPTGIKIMHAAANKIKGVSLELGGKSAMIICADADIDSTVDWILAGIFQNSGQMCSATSRLLVHHHIHDVLVRELVERTKTLKVGDPLGPDGVNIKMGPVVSEGQRDKVLGFIDRAVKANAKLEIGGGRPHNSTAPQGGFYVEPTIFTNVTPNMEIWKEEIFGPVLSIMSYSEENEAIRLANDTPFGLAASVMSSDRAATRRIANQLRA